MRSAATWSTLELLSMASVAVFFVAASFGHIHIGTIGAEGTFEGLWRGRVDAVWAKQHQDLWYEKKMAERGEQSG